MGSRRLRPMGVADLARLPEPCGQCAFWESSLPDLAAPADHADRPALKADWAQAVVDRWGFCGVVAVAEGEIVGYLTMAPAGYVRRLGAFATEPVRPDVAVLLAAQVAERWRGNGLGRQLVQSAAGLLARRDLRAVEAVGTYREGPSCIMPVPWLEAVGFTVVRAHPVTPRLRMDLQNTVRWRPDLGAAWHRLTGLVQSPATPEPAAYAGREGSGSGAGSPTATVRPRLSATVGH